MKGALQISYGYRLIRMNGKVYFFTKLVAMTWSYNENPDENTMIDHIMGSQSGVNTREIMSYKFMMRK